MYCLALKTYSVSRLYFVFSWCIIENDHSFDRTKGLANVFLKWTNLSIYIIFRGEPPFQMYVYNFQRWAPHLCTIIDNFQRWASYLFSRVDEFQRWAPYVFIMSWWFSEVGPPIYVLWVDDFQRWSPYFFTMSGWFSELIWITFLLTSVTQKSWPNAVCYYAWSAFLRSRHYFTLHQLRGAHLWGSLIPTVA